MNETNNMNELNNISQIKNIFYINLESRTDRKYLVEKELTNLGLTTFIRFNAINHLHHPAVGCSMSHLSCLQLAKTNGWSHVLILEDDIQFLNPALFINQLNLFLSSTNKWDVILFAGNNMLKEQETLGDYAIKVQWCQTTTGYLVASHYFDTMIHNIKSGAQQLIRYPEKHALYAIDQHWVQLQKKDNWYLIIPPSVIQRDGYSDIEKRNTTYRKAMLILNKSIIK